MSLMKRAVGASFFILLLSMVVSPLLGKADPDPSKTTETIADLEKALHFTLVGQKTLKLALIALTKQALAGLADHSGPAVRLLIAGPRGTGKTEVGKLYAQVLGLPHVSVDLSIFKDGSVQTLLAEIVVALRQNPRTVLLFSGVESAHPKALRILIALLQNRNFTVVEQRRGEAALSIQVSGKLATVIATTTAGSAFILASTGLIHGPFGFTPHAARAGLVNEDALREALIGNGISADFIKLFPMVVHMLPATKEEFREILRRQFVRAQIQFFEMKGIRVNLSNEDELLDTLVKRYWREAVTNLVVLDAVRDYFTFPLSDFLTAAGAAPGSQLSLAYQFQNNTFSIEAEDSPDETMIAEKISTRAVPSCAQFIAGP